jgi:hypothetical protein
MYYDGTVLREPKYKVFVVRCVAVGRRESFGAVFPVHVPGRRLIDGCWKTDVRMTPGSPELIPAFAIPHKLLSGPLVANSGPQYF